MQKTYSSSSSNYSSTSSSSISVKPIAAPRSGAASRQRVQPIDIPPSPELNSKSEGGFKLSPEKSLLGTSPLQAELESLFKNRMTISSLSSTPPVPKSPVLPPASPNSWSQHRFNKTNENKAFSNTRETRLEEFRSKMKIAGLSALQQRVLSHNDDETDDGSAGFKSLTDLPTDVIRVNKPVTKSHSFKAVKPSFQQSENNRFTYTSSHQTKEISSEKTMTTEQKRQSIVKAASLDSVKNLETPPLEFKKTAMKNETEESFIKTDDVTISGPSHTAIVNVTSSEHSKQNEVIKTSSNDQQQVSVTKIHMKREKDSTKTIVPEFINRQLNKVENKSSTNVIFKTPSPKIVDEQTKPKATTIFNFEPEIPKRKFSKEDVEIIDKEVNEEIVEVPKTPLVPITPMTPQSNRIYKKHNSERKSSTSKSESLKSADSSSQDSLDKLDDKVDEPPQTPTDGVVLRKKSLVKQKAEEEPELMKVFARRSLKLKDSESEELSQQVKTMVEESDSLQKSRDSDKENHTNSPPEERKKSVITKELTKIETRRKSIGKEPLAETKFVETTEVTLRKPIVPNNKFAAYQRTISMNTPKTTEIVNSELKVKKQSSFNERPKTENWFLNLKKQEEEKTEDRKIVSDEILISPKSDFINEEEFTIKPKNFNQRKAEWEKRAQEALKKNVP